MKTLGIQMMQEMTAHNGGKMQLLMSLMNMGIIDVHDVGDHNVIDWYKWNLILAKYFKLM